MSWKVLVTARAFWVSGDDASSRLNEAGCTVVRSPRAGPIPEDELTALLDGCDAVIASSDPYTARMFALLPHFKMVARCGVGYDRVDVGAATNAGVIVTTTPGAMTDAVADYTIGLMLAVARSIPAGDALMRGGGWSEYPGVQFPGKTLGLVGFGAIGRGTARRAAGFDMKIIAYDPVWSNSSKMPSDMPAVEFTTLDDLLARSDFVSLHAPALPETRRMFDAARFAQMKPSAYFINTARGALVDEMALIEALENKTIAGAAVDVYEEEPCPADHPLRKAPRCVLTPHNAFNAVEAAELMSNLCADNILAAMNGKRPPGLLNPSVLESPTLRGPRP
jgi:D-3-phosphoglycerate dehydrogenase